jgi:hypothetical protein
MQTALTSRIAAKPYKTSDFAVLAKFYTQQQGGFPPWPGPMTMTLTRNPGWFRDELRQRDRLIADLRQEQDEAGGDRVRSSPDSAPRA